MIKFIKNILDDMDWENKPNSNLAQVKQYCKTNGLPLEPYESAWFTLYDRLFGFFVPKEKYKEYLKIKIDQKNWQEKYNEEMRIAHV